MEMEQSGILSRNSRGPEILLAAYGGGVTSPLIPASLPPSLSSPPSSATEMKSSYLRALSHIVNNLPRQVQLSELPAVSCPGGGGVEDLEPRRTPDFLSLNIVQRELYQVPKLTTPRSQQKQAENSI